MAQFKDIFRFSIDDQTVRFSISISDFYVIEHRIPVTTFQSYLRDWDGVLFESNEMIIKIKQDMFAQVSIMNDNDSHIYRLSPSDFARWNALIKRSIPLDSIEEPAEEE